MKDKESERLRYVIQNKCEQTQFKQEKFLLTAEQPFLFDSALVMA
jgi:hypothetical protein